MDDWEAMQQCGLFYYEEILIINTVHIFGLTTSTLLTVTPFFSDVISENRIDCMLRVNIVIDYVVMVRRRELSRSLHP